MFENWNRFVQEVTTGRYKDGKGSEKAVEDTLQLQSDSKIQKQADKRTSEADSSGTEPTSRN